jgi:pimeloyl-ACP methyl ester carboxylesterase
MAERMIKVNDVELCTEAFGSQGDPPVLLVMGLGASMLWWPETFCRLLAEHGRFVVRYDHRDTGRSVTYEPGRPGYKSADLVADAVGVLDAYGVGPAHVVGVSAGGALAQLVALGFPDRVLTLVLISTSPATAGRRSLPPATERFNAFVTSASVDWSDQTSVIDYLLAYERMLAGDRRPFDDTTWRDLVSSDVARARDIEASQNHTLLEQGDVPADPISSIRAPTLVIHGAADPMFPLAHGRALTDEIPGAHLLTLEGAGHGIEPVDWEPVARAIVAHTA